MQKNEMVLNVKGQHCHLVGAENNNRSETYLWSSVSGSTKMFSCLSFTRRNTKESKQGLGTGITLEHMGFSVTVSENLNTNVTNCQHMPISVLCMSH